MPLDRPPFSEPNRLTLLQFLPEKTSSVCVSVSFLLIVQLYTTNHYLSTIYLIFIYIQNILTFYGIVQLLSTGGSFSMQTRLFQRCCLTNTPDPWNGAPIQIVCCIFIFASIWSSGICPGPSTITCTSFAHARFVSSPRRTSSSI